MAELNEQGEKTQEMQHPTLPDVVQPVPLDYVPAWEAQGWVQKASAKPRKASASAAKTTSGRTAKKATKRASSGG